MQKEFNKTHVSNQLFECTVSVPLEQCCHKRTKVYQKIWWSTRKTMMTRLITVGVFLAILLPLTVPLKPIPMTANQRKGIKDTLNYSLKSVIQSVKSGEPDLIAQSSKNLTLKHDVNKNLQKTWSGHNLDISDTSAQNEVLLKPHSNTIIESQIESIASDFSGRDHKLKNKSLPLLSIAQNIRQTNVYFRSISLTSNNANETNPVSTSQRLELAPGPKSISVSRESNGHRVRKVISGIGIETIGRTTQAFFSRSPVVSVKHEMESQKSKRPEFPPFTAGTPIKMFEARDRRDRLNSSLDIISNGIYWSKQLERLTPKGFDQLDDIRWSQLINSSNIIKMANGCGRMQNRLITLEDGHKSCARHRQNSDQIQGDIFSFYLGRVLNISNIPPATIAVVKAADSQNFQNQWSAVRTQLISSKWEKPVVMTQFVDNLEPAFIPKLLRNSNRRLHPVSEDIGSLSVSELTELVQWSDLIVFDYLTANLDRIVNNMINEKWNPEMMRNPAHNLLKVTDTGLLLFIDNESGLFHGYRLLKKYERQHWSLLKSLCIFREKTVKLIEDLHKNRNFIYLIKSLFREYVLDDTAFKSVPFLPEPNIKILYERLNRVYNQINSCKSMYKNNSIIKSTKL